MTFGEYIKSKRLEKQLTLRGFAQMIEISPVYMSSLENNRCKAPSEEVLERMSVKLSMSKEEREMLYDLASKEQTTKNPVPKDLTSFLRDNRIIVSALRTAKDLDATDEEWNEFIEKLKKSREVRNYGRNVL